MPDRESCWRTSYLDSTCPRWIVYACNFLFGALACAGFLTAQGRWSGVALLVGAAGALWALAARYRKTLVVGPGGLLIRCRGGQQRVSWDAIRGFRYDHEELVIEADGASLRLPWTAHRDRLAGLLNRRLRSSSEPPSADPLAASEIETWLGVEPGGRVSAQPRRRRRRMAWAAAGRSWIIAAWWPAGVMLLEPHGVDHLEVLALLAMVTILSLLLAVSGLFVTPAGGTPEALRHADGHGLSLRMGRRRVWLDWAAIERVIREETGVLLVTTQGRFTLDLSDAETELVVAVAERVLAAREAGQAPPRLDGVPDGAISAATLTPAVGDRGLSRTAEAGYRSSPKCRRSITAITSALKPRL